MFINDILIEYEQRDAKIRKLEDDKNQYFVEGEAKGKVAVAKSMLTLGIDIQVILLPQESLFQKLRF